MPASTQNFAPTQITDQFGYFWVDVAVPGAGARITLFTDGSPDSTSNPNAKHLGHTTEGWEFTARKESDDITVDEAVAPIDTVITNIPAALAANLAQTQDIGGVLKHLAQGFGTYSTAAGYEQITMGIIPLTYLAVALITPTKADSTKFFVYNLYKSLNDSGLANQIRRRGLGNNPVAFRGLSLTSRATTDQIGNVWKQI